MLTESGTHEGIPSLVSVQNQIPHDLEVYADPIIRKIFTTLMENTIRHGENLISFLSSSHEIAESLIITSDGDDIEILPDERDQIINQGYGRYTRIGFCLPKEYLESTDSLFRRMEND